MTHIRVSTEVREAIKRLKRSDESVDDYLHRKIQEEDMDVRAINLESLLLTALDLVRKQKTKEATGWNLQPQATASTATP